MVYGGVLETSEGHVNVAIKTVKTGLRVAKASLTSSLKGLMSEIKLLGFIGMHDNIVRLYGACTKNLKDGQLLVLLEFCENGSLLKYLHSIKPDDPTEHVLEMEDDNARYKNMKSKNSLDPELSKKFLKWSTDICNGMEYLASKGVSG